jgi:hypothetical protein
VDESARAVPPTTASLPARPQHEERHAEHQAAHGPPGSRRREDVAAHRGKPSRVELEPDHEEHQHHAQLGERVRPDASPTRARPQGRWTRRR